MNKVRMPDGVSRDAWRTKQDCSEDPLDVPLIRTIQSNGMPVILLVQSGRVDRMLPSPDICAVQVQVTLQ